MTLSELRTSYAWHESLDLAPHLVRIAEQLPDSEMAGLAASLRELSANVPSAIAAELVAGAPSALVQTLRAVATLEVIERVYPALDTATARAACDALAERVVGPDFAARIAPPVAPVDPDNESMTPETNIPVAPAISVAASPAPVQSTTLAMPAVTAEQPAAPTTIPVFGAPSSVPPTPGANDNVYPDSPQQAA
jgi:hypothetical protein